MNSSKKRGKKMTITGFKEKNGDYFLGRYVEYWKSGSYFHKRVHYLKCKRFSDGFYSLDHKQNLYYLGHNITVVFQAPILKALLDKKAPVCWNDNEY